MPLIEPGPVEKIINWFKGLSGDIRQTQIEFGRPAAAKQATKVIWTKTLDKERRVEVLAREDKLFSFREMKLVTKGPDTFDVEIYASGLYDDIKEITRATSDYILNDGASRK